MKAKPVRTILWMLALLAAAELALRALARPAGGALPADRAICLVLGTSRARAGVAPEGIEQVLAARGYERPFAANLSLEAATTVGLSRRYVEELHALAPLPPGARAVLLIEARPSGLNDAYVAPDERAWLETHPVRYDDRGVPSVGEQGALAHLSAGRFDAGARALVGGLALARADRTLAPRLRARFGAGFGGSASGGDASDAASLLPGLDRDWTRPPRGFVPYPDAPEPGLRERTWREHYRNVLLKDFRFGGLQTDHLRLIVRLARADGFRPVLFTMPITAVHETFFEPGDYEAIRAHVRAFAALEGVPLVDLDAALALGDDAFVDTHHLRFSSVAPVTAALAERAVLPALR